MDAAGAGGELLAFCANARLPKLSRKTSASTKLITFLTVASPYSLIGRLCRPLKLGKTTAGLKSGRTIRLKSTGAEPLSRSSPTHLARAAKLVPAQLSLKAHET